MIGIKITIHIFLNDLLFLLKHSKVCSHTSGFNKCLWSANLPSTVRSLKGNSLLSVEKVRSRKIKCLAQVYPVSEEVGI